MQLLREHYLSYHQHHLITYSASTSTAAITPTINSIHTWPVEFSTFNSTYKNFSIIQEQQSNSSFIDISQQYYLLYSKQ